MPSPDASRNGTDINLDLREPNDTLDEYATMLDGAVQFVWHRPTTWTMLYNLHSIVQHGGHGYAIRVTLSTYFG